jgi:hypothetical protein
LAWSLCGTVETLHCLGTQANVEGMKAWLAVHVTVPEYASPEIW